MKIRARSQHPRRTCDSFASITDGRTKDESLTNDLFECLSQVYAMECKVFDKRGVIFEAHSTSDVIEGTCVRKRQSGRSVD